jgi:hypothetical protein
MGPTLAAGLLTGYDATAGILRTTLSKIPPSLSVVSISLELRPLARFQDLQSDSKKIRLTVFLNMLPFIVIEICQKFDGSHYNFSQGLEVAAIVSVEAFVIFYHSVGRQISEDSNYQRFYWHIILKVYASCSETFNPISAVVNGMDTAHS